MNIIILSIALFLGMTTSEHPKLILNITNIESVKGNLVVGVFNTEENFLENGSAIKTYTYKVDKTSKQIVISDLPKGEYAISLFHDENSDAECNRNFLGIPKEGYGFSNNVKPKFSAPTYNDCKFTLSQDTTLTIKMLN
ncbi:uncharacterized protein (DUF2141 family) [Gelidibacter sediminis]|uniref:Uncharacterized protein (DUF2141 family) n=1 Tax=Gelidibacter sediminis TaxID=1608710 RepID=A0A4R7PZL4_9FLAO|nr:DUF2141 domain-containing protein [Gelidibacter sediminis]TDU40495.1 uncharacterized protein (DUF2141 family) [Gelidibacter sediminis]